MASDRIAREAAAIGTAIETARSGKNPAEGAASLCLVRVVQGLDETQWERLRQAHKLEGWLAAPPQELPALLGSPLDDDAEGRLIGFLRCEMERARLCQQPLALALIEPETADMLDDIHTLAAAQLRLIDHAERLDGARLAVVLSGTPLAAAERLLGAMLRRIRQVSEPSLVCSAGLVGYGGLAALGTGDLMDRAFQALTEARRLGGNRLEVAPSADAELACRETLVRASEKHFLFTGKKLPE